MKNFLILLTILFVLLAPLTLRSQSIPRAIVTGRVLDDSTAAALPLANVFVSNSTIGAASDSAGRFTLKNIPVGNQKIVASLVGYASQTIAIQLTDSTAYTVEFRLKPHAVEIQGVEVEAKEPEGWKDNLQRFLKEFLGTGPNAEQCKVLNPEVLDFTIGDKGMLVASARTPLEIENRFLGYHVHIFLDYFTARQNSLIMTPASAGGVDQLQYDILWGGYIRRVRPEPVITGAAPTTMEFLCRTRFTPLASGDEKEGALWKENRRKAYLGSLRHFLTSLVSGRAESEGFETYKIRQTSNRNFPTLTLAVGADALLKPGVYSFERRLSFSSALEVTYRSDDGILKSFIRLSQPDVIIYVNGTVAVPLSITTFGYWASQRVADMLPTDYTPDD